MKIYFGFLKILSLVFFLHALVFLWVFKVFLSFPCVLILKFLSLVFLGVFAPKFSKTRSIRSKNFKSCAILLFFSFLFKFKNFRNLPLKFRFLFQNLKPFSKKFIISFSKLPNHFLSPQFFENLHSIFIYFNLFHFQNKYIKNKKNIFSILHHLPFSIMDLSGNEQSRRTLGSYSNPSTASYGSSICIPSIGVSSFELNPQLIIMVQQNCQYSGLP